jgi:hypothetical protein
VCVCVCVEVLSCCLFLSATALGARSIPWAIGRVGGGTATLLFRLSAHSVSASLKHVSDCLCHARWLTSTREGTHQGGGYCRLALPAWHVSTTHASQWKAGQMGHRSRIAWSHGQSADDVIRWISVLSGQMSSPSRVACLLLYHRCIQTSPGFTNTDMQPLTARSNTNPLREQFKYCRRAALNPTQSLKLLFINLQRKATVP